MKTTFEGDLLLKIDRDDALPLHLQLQREMRAAIRSGRLEAGSPLPSTRAFASTLGVSRGVVVEAYEQLTAEGYLSTHVGSGTRIAAVHVGATGSVSAPLAKAWPRFDFRPGMPDLDAFPKRAWLSCMRRALATAPRDALGYPHPEGPHPTREVLAAYLARSRATVGGAENMVLCNGFTQGIDLIARMLKERKVRSVAIEDPGYDGLVRLFESLGIAAPRIPVDERGLLVDRLARTAATAVVVTPAHQFPTGAGMAPERRAELLRWAVSRNALIVEDDYDAEFRYDREPVGALQGLAPEHVIYVGTTSKTLSPALRLGWLLAPTHVVKDLARLKRRADRGSPTLEQLALAEFIDTGQLDRQLKKMRVIYRSRRDTLIDALEVHLPRSSIHGVAAGLHMMLSLPVECNERDLIRAADEESIRIFGVGPYHADPDAKHPALVLGYGGLKDALIVEGATRIAELVGRQLSDKPTSRRPTPPRRPSIRSR